MDLYQADLISSLDNALAMISARDSNSHGPSPSPSLSSSPSPSELGRAPISKAAEMDESGGWARLSKRSSVSSTSSAALTEVFDRPGPPSRSSTAASSAVPSQATQTSPSRLLDPLARQYPAPTRDINVEEMLKRPPRKWTLGHYFHKSRQLHGSAISSKTTQDSKAKELDKAKMELLAAKEQIRRLSLERT